QVWFQPLKVDSLAIAVTKEKYSKSYTVKMKDQKKDTLFFAAVQSGTLNLKDRFTIKSSTPLDKFDNSKIKLINKDSLSVDFKMEYNEFNQELFFDFKKEPLEKYTFNIFPGALTDYLEQTNDTLTYKLTT